jgi:hypothetical protein
MKRPLALIALAGLTLTGCSSLTAVPAPKSSNSPAATVAATTTAPATASVADYIAGTTSIKRTTHEWIDTYESNGCRAGSFQEEPLCSIPIVSVEMQAETAGMVLEGLGSPTNTTYVGAPPAELASRVEAAVEIAAKIKKNAAAINDDDCHETLGCGTHWWDVTMGMQDLADELDSWEAYK